MKRKRSKKAQALDWFAVFLAIEGLTFLIAWQMYPAWDDTQILPTFFRTVLIAGPITLSMWGVARATAPGSAVPRYMAETLHYATLNPDGTTGVTTPAEAKKGPVSEHD
jgi:hypothetical protein